MNSSLQNRVLLAKTTVHEQRALQVLAERRPGGGGWCGGRGGGDLPVRAGVRAGDMLCLARMRGTIYGEYFGFLAAERARARQVEFTAAFIGKAACHGSILLTVGTLETAGPQDLPLHTAVGSVYEGLCSDVVG